MKILDKGEKQAGLRQQITVELINEHLETIQVKDQTLPLIRAVNLRPSRLYRQQITHLNRVITRETCLKSQGIRAPIQQEAQVFIHNQILQPALLTVLVVE